MNKPMYVQVYRNSKGEVRTNAMCTPSEMSALIRGDEKTREELKEKFGKASVRFNGR